MVRWVVEWVDEWGLTNSREFPSEQAALDCADEIYKLYPVRIYKKQIW